MSNNQEKKLAAKIFNEERQEKIDDAPRLAAEREEEYNSPLARQKRKHVKMMLAATIGFTS